MKLLLYSAVAATLVLSSCSSAYKSTQTPDDVYNSPSGNSTRNASSRNTDNGSSNTTADDGSTYVTYDDGSQYDSDYGRRMNMFSGSYVSGNYSDYYSAPIGMSAYYGSPYYSYSPFGGFGMGMGYGMGLGFGMGFGYGLYSPFYSPFYNPWYSPYYAYGYPYGGGYYHGGYYGGGHAGGGYYSNPVNRIRTNGAPTAGNGFNNNGGFVGGRTRTGVAPAGNSTNVGVGNRRVFTPSSSEQSGYSRPTRTFSQPNYQAPTRTFSQPSYSAPRSSGGGGGGFSGGGGGRRR